MKTFYNCEVILSKKEGDFKVKLNDILQKQNELLETAVLRELRKNKNSYGCGSQPKFRIVKIEKSGVSWR